MSQLLNSISMLDSDNPDVQTRCSGSQDAIETLRSVDGAQVITCKVYTSVIPFTICIHVSCAERINSIIAQYP